MNLLLQWLMNLLLLVQIIIFKILVSFRSHLKDIKMTLTLKEVEESLHYYPYLHVFASVLPSPSCGFRSSCRCANTFAGKVERHRGIWKQQLQQQKSRTVSFGGSADFCWFIVFVSEGGGLLGVTTDWTFTAQKAVLLLTSPCLCIPTLCSCRMGSG